MAGAARLLDRAHAVDVARRAPRNSRSRARPAGSAAAQPHLRRHAIDPTGRDVLLDPPACILRRQPSGQKATRSSTVMPAASARRSVTHFPPGPRLAPRLAPCRTACLALDREGQVAAGKPHARELDALLVEQTSAPSPGHRRSPADRQRPRAGSTCSAPMSNCPARPSQAAVRIAPQIGIAGDVRIDRRGAHAEIARPAAARGPDRRESAARAMSNGIGSPRPLGPSPFSATIGPAETRSACRPSRASPMPRPSTVPPIRSQPFQLAASAAPVPPPENGRS